VGRRAKPSKENCPYVTKGGLKLEFALRHFAVSPTALVAADLGSHQGGFVDCLLQHAASRVYAVDTCYGTLAWSLRQNLRVVVCERQNALYWLAPEPLNLITIDVGWTRQEYVIPSAIKNLSSAGTILSLLKPQYEAGFAKTSQGVLDAEQLQAAVERVVGWLQTRFRHIASVPSPYLGSGGNQEVWLCLRNPL
jgi:23S rRNA (cytidine1920-2'-O)/16S rRNA (cytidine1409-2'-O)-methyltransferase